VLDMFTLIEACLVVFDTRSLWYWSKFPQYFLRLLRREPENDST